jgi:hypothetical protein
MVDLALLQSISYMAGALGVCIAALSFVLNMRATTKNRKVTFTTNLLSTTASKEGILDFYELMSMRWTDFDDFKRKYDSRVNPENFIKRVHKWNIFRNVGWQLRAGVVDWDTVRKITGRDMMNMWLKFEPIIKEYRKQEYRSDQYADWEYIAQRMEEDLSLEEKKKSQYVINDAFKNENTRAT